MRRIGIITGTRAEHVSVEKTVLGKDKNTSGGVTQFQFGERCVEQEFKAIGMASFFDTGEDNNVDWEDFFDVASVETKPLRDI